MGVLCFAGAFVAIADAANVTETGLNVALCGVGSTVCPPMSSAAFIGLIVGSIIGFPVVLLFLGLLGLLGELFLDNLFLACAFTLKVGLPGKRTTCSFYTP